MGMNDINSLSHTKWNCKYHFVFAPKYRRKVFYYEKRAAVGKILRQLEGDGGFGYDPLFYVEELGKTFAQLSMAEKNQISHRGKANQKAVAILQQLKGESR